MPEQVCALLDHFAIVIQVLLGTIAFSTLIYKRHRERPQRPVKIWLFDSSKQVIGACMMHALNLLASYIAGSHHEESSNPCVWYFLNIFLDCSLGVFILFVILRFVHKGITAIGIRGMQSGEYGIPPKWTWWLKQTIVFIFCLFCMKLIVVILLRIAPFLSDAGEWAIRWTENDERLQVVFVLLIFPLIMNIIQFWLVDYVIKKRFEHVKLTDLDAFGDEDAFLQRGSLDMDEMSTSNGKRSFHHSQLSSGTPVSLTRVSMSEDKESVQIDRQNVQETSYELKKTSS